MEPFVNASGVVRAHARWGSFEFNHASPDIVLKCLEKLTKIMSEEGLTIDEHPNGKQIRVYHNSNLVEFSWGGIGKTLPEAILVAALEASK